MTKIPNFASLRLGGRIFFSVQFSLMIPLNMPVPAGKVIELE